MQESPTAGNCKQCVLVVWLRCFDHLRREHHESSICDFLQYVIGPAEIYRRDVVIDNTPCCPVKMSLCLVHPWITTHGVNEQISTLLDVHSSEGKKCCAIIADNAVKAMPVNYGVYGLDRQFVSADDICQVE